jgi:hypothetical protein
MQGLQRDQRDDQNREHRLLADERPYSSERARRNALDI